MVFASTVGTPIEPDNLSRSWYQVRKVLDAPLPRFHDLRHLHATLLLLEGVPVHVVANRLGHSDPAVTLRVYAHVLRESASGVADIFARAVSKATVSKSVSKMGPEKHETRGPVLSPAGLWWPGAGSNRRPSDFQSDARTN
jgi:hypothetical protein